MCERGIKLEAGKKLLFDHNAIQSGLNHIADQIISEFKPEALKEIAMIGIQTRGVAIAGRLREAIKERSGIAPESATLDITMYRDDIGKRNALPIIHETDIPFDIDEKTVILVDDILHTGRTIRAALDALTYYGRPAMIRLAVLVDRDGREFPIQADYTGLSAKLPEGRKMRIEFGERPNQDAIYDIKKKAIKLPKIK